MRIFRPPRGTTNVDQKERKKERTTGDLLRCNGDRPTHEDRAFLKRSLGQRRARAPYKHAHGHGHGHAHPHAHAYTGRLDIDRQTDRQAVGQSHCHGGNPIQSNPIESNPIQSSPIQSNPIQSNAIQCSLRRRLTSTNGARRRGTHFHGAMKTETPTQCWWSSSLRRCRRCHHHNFAAGSVPLASCSCIPPST